MPDVTLTIDGTSVTVPAGTLLVEAAKTIDIDVPVYCYHPRLGPAGLCRICLVDIEKMPKLQIACNTVVAEGMVVHTVGQKVEDGRRAVMEFLLLNHPLDCPICDKGGECDLQDFSMAYGQGASRLVDPKSSKPKAIDLGPTIVLDDERCIVCQRCSRFDDLITHERSLVVKDRGQRDVIATATGDPYRSNFSGNVTELCPVGALTSKTYRFKSRPWDNQRTATTCTQCSVGCQLYVDERYGTLARTLSMQQDDAVSDGWLCDRGRYNIGFYSDERRLTSPLLRRGDEWLQIGWDDALELWAKGLREALAAGGPAAVAALGGGRLLGEEIVLLERTMRGLGVEQLDWRTGRQRQASPGRYGGTYADLERAQLIVAVGRPPSQTAPVLDLRIRKAVSLHGARYLTLGLHAAGSFVPAQPLDAPEALATVATGVERVAVVWDGVDLALGARVSTALDALAAAGASVHAYVPGEQNNARGAEALGLVPRAGAHGALGILAAAERGDLRALSLFGANPVLSHPLGAERVRATLRAVPFVVATDLFATETVALAHLVLPVRGAFEKSGHVYDLAGDILRVEQAHAAPEGPLADGDLLVALAAELGVAIPAPGALLAAATTPPGPASHALGDQAFDEGQATAGRSRPAPAPDTGGATVTRRAPHGALQVAVAANIFAGGGTMRFDERLAALRPDPTATLAPDTAAALGVAPGDLVTLEASDGSLLPGLVVRVDDEAREHVVTVIDGLPEAPANGLADGDLANLRPAPGLARVREPV